MKPLLRRLLLWVALPVLLVALAVWSWTPREPTWDGRSLSEWLKDLEPARMKSPSAVDEQNAAAARRAIQGMGTNCLPFLLRRIESQNPTPLEKRLIKFEDLLAKEYVTIPWTRTQTRVEVRVADAFYAVQALGHEAAPAVPELQRWMCSSNANIAYTAAFLLGYIHPEGTAVLIAASTNRIILSREAVVVMLDGIASKHPQALTALLGMAADPDPWIRGQVGYLLAKRPDEAAVIWPVVNRLLADPDGLVRREVIGGLLRCKGDIRPAESALTSLVADPDPEISKVANRLLVKIKATPATPPPPAPAPPP